MGWLMINLSLIILSSNKGSSLEDGIEIIFSDENNLVDEGGNLLPALFGGSPWCWIPKEGEGTGCR